jgi:hypothetical protein
MRFNRFCRAGLENMEVGMWPDEIWEYLPEKAKQGIKYLWVFIPPIVLFFGLRLYQDTFFTITFMVVLAFISYMIRLWIEIQDKYKHLK